jgi:hypothetical protein
MYGDWLPCLMGLGLLDICDKDGDEGYVGGG